MKKVLSISLVSVLLGFTSAWAQILNQSNPLVLLKKNIETPFEKVYLHLDRSYYSSGEDIWFKAYLVDALTNQLFDHSNTLYVELISPGSKIIDRLVLRIDSGIGYGDIHLKDSIASGNYQIRAYTNWMRNFDETFFFKKEISIENLIGIKTLTQSNLQDDEKNIDIQFFPEGGSLIENVNTTIGFKAVNSSGYGCDIKGEIFSSPGDSVVSFSSSHLGMGSFIFISKKGLKYFAVGHGANGVPFNIELPGALTTGYSIRVSEANKDSIRITIRTNQETLAQFPSKELVIIGTTHNLNCIAAKARLRALINSYILPKSVFPEGIARISLMDTISNTYCERLYYIHHREYCNIQIVPDKNVFVPREKVSLKISVKDTANKPVHAHLSISVIDGRQVKDSEKAQNIRSYFLLESEIRGYIEQPYYYFDTSNNNRSKALDNLLLTQGWRNFIWKDLVDSGFSINYDMEKGITISGRVRGVWIDKPVANANISMALLDNTKPSVYFSKTDSSGKYCFDGLNFTGFQKILINSLNKKDIGQGWILLDSINGNPAPPKYISSLKSQSMNVEFSDYIGEADKKYSILKKYHLTDTIPINEVVIKRRKLEKEYDDGHQRSMYGEPDNSIKITDEMENYHDIFQVLIGTVSGFTGFSFHGQVGAALLLIDGKEVSLETMKDLPVSAVDKVEILKSGGKLALYGMKGSFGVMNVLTKRGHNSKVIPNFYTIDQRVYGYYQSRIFYSPKYDVPKPEYEKPDFRTTIYWDPNIVTDADGNATVLFFNTDSKTIIKAEVEGIAESGIPLVGNTTIEVK